MANQNHIINRIKKEGECTTNPIVEIKDFGKITKRYQALKIIKKNAETISPKDLQAILRTFPSICKAVIKLYLKNIKGNKERVKAVLWAMSKDDILSLIEKLPKPKDIKIARATIVSYHTYALDIIPILKRKGYNDCVIAKTIARVTAESQIPDECINKLFWQIAKENLINFEECAWFNPHNPSQPLRQL